MVDEAVGNGLVLLSFVYFTCKRNKPVVLLLNNAPHTPSQLNQFVFAFFVVS